MSGTTWTEAELKRLRRLYKNKPEWTTDYTYSLLLSKEFKRSPESVRWQLRQLHRSRLDAVIVKPPKILLLDIETNPIEALVWDVWKQDIHPEQIKKDWSILCWSAKWLFEPKVIGASVLPQEAVAHEDRSVLMRLWELMNEADVIVWHNGNDFDRKKINTRFFVENYPKPMYYQSIDTLKVAKENFSLTYNKLDWIASVIGVGRKIETSFKWWKECEAGNKQYLDLMLKYNNQDIHLEEEVYLRLRPWMEKHPNMNLYANMVGDCCPTCGSNNLNWKGKYATGLGLYKAFRCEECGAIGRSTLKKNKINASEVQN